MKNNKLIMEENKTIFLKNCNTFRNEKLNFLKLKLKA